MARSKTPLPVRQLSPSLLSRSFGSGLPRQTMNELGSAGTRCPHSTCTQGAP